jgi:hypothetical protein
MNTHLLTRMVTELLTNVSLAQEMEKNEENNGNTT